MTVRLSLLALSVCLLPGLADLVVPRRATLTGSRGDRGKCTIEVVVDDVAEVEIAGDTGRLRTLSGRPAEWRRMECSDPLPRNPYEFRFIGVDGRGRQTLIRDPRNTRGVAVIRIEDPQGGREGYTFDIEWRGQGGPYDSRPTYPPPPGPGPGASNAIGICQDAARAEADRRYGVRRVNFLETRVDDNPGRHDWIIGFFEDRDYRRDRYSFACSVDLRSGRVRSVEVRRR